MIEVDVSNNIAPEAWESLHREMEGNIFQTFPWIRAMQKSGLAPVFFIARENSRVRGALALFIRNYRIPLLGRHKSGRIPSLVGMGKPLLDGEKNGVFKAIMKSVDEQAAVLKAASLNWPTDFTLFEEPDCLKSCGFEVVPFGTYRLDLAKGIDALWKNLHKHKRRNIKKARKNDVCVRQSNNLNTYLALHAQLAAKLKYPVQSVSDRIRNIFDCLKNEGRCKLFIAYHNSEAVSGAFILLGNDTAYYLYGASAKDDKSASSHLLHWTVVEWAHENGLKFYDFLGVVPEDRADAAIRGVNRFKREFNGDFCPRYGAVKIYSRGRTELIKKLGWVKRRIRKLL